MMPDLALASDVAEWVRAFRTRRGVTQTELAAYLGWPQSVLARLESGRHQPTVATMAHLSTMLGATFRIYLSRQGTQVKITRPTLRTSRRHIVPTSIPT